VIVQKLVEVRVAEVVFELASRRHGEAEMIGDPVRLHVPDRLPHAITRRDGRHGSFLHHSITWILSTAHQVSS